MRKTKMRWTSVGSLATEYALLRSGARPRRQLVSLTTTEMTAWLGHDQAKLEMDIERITQ